MCGRSALAPVSRRRHAELTLERAVERRFRLIANIGRNSRHAPGRRGQGLRGETQTLTLTIYEQLEASFDVALSIGILLVVISAGVLLSYKLLLWRRSTSNSPTPFAPSSSAAA